MYGYLKKARALEIAATCEEVVDIVFDIAHNSNPEDEELICGFDQKDWDKIALWEKHIKKCASNMLENIKFDIEQDNFDKIT